MDIVDNSIETDWEEVGQSGLRYRTEVAMGTSGCELYGGRNYCFCSFCVSRASSS